MNKDKNTIQLYHPSDTKFQIVKTKYFGKHIYTKTEMQSSLLKRTFWYTKLPIPEKRFRYSPYIYVTKILKKKIYNLKKDPKKLINKFTLIHDLLIYLKQHYLGAIYRPNGYNIVCIFQDIKPIEIIENN